MYWNNYDCEHCCTEAAPSHPPADRTNVPDLGLAQADSRHPQPTGLWRSEAANCRRWRKPSCCKLPTVASVAAEVFRWLPTFLTWHPCNQCDVFWAQKQGWMGFQESPDAHLENLYIPCCPSQKAMISYNVLRYATFVQRYNGKCKDILTCFRLCCF